MAAGKCDIKRGIEIAAVLGCVAGRAEYGLEVLKEVEESHIEKVQEMLRQGRVEIGLKDCEGRLYLAMIK